MGSDVSGGNEGDRGAGGAVGEGLPALDMKAALKAAAFKVPS